MIDFLEDDEFKELVTLRNLLAIINYENLPWEEKNNEKHGLLDTVSLVF